MIKINTNKTDFTTIFCPVVREISYSGYDPEEIAKSAPKTYDVNIIAIKDSDIGFCNLKFSTFCQAVKSAMNQIGSKIQPSNFYTLNQRITVYSINETGRRGYLSNNDVDELFDNYEIYKANNNADFMNLLRTYGINGVKIILFKRHRIRWLSRSYFEAHLLIEKEIEDLVRSANRSFNDLLVLAPRQYKSSDERYGQLDLFS